MSKWVNEVKQPIKILIHRNRLIDQSDFRVWRRISEHVQRWQQRASLVLKQPIVEYWIIILKWIIFWKILLIFPKYCQVFSKNKILAPNKRSQEWAFFYQLFKRKYFTAEMNQFIFNKIIGEMRMVLQILVSDKYMLQFFKMEKSLRPFWNFKSINFHS